MKHDIYKEKLCLLTPQGMAITHIQWKGMPVHYSRPVVIAVGSGACSMVKQACKNKAIIRQLNCYLCCAHASQSNADGYTGRQKAEACLDWVANMVKHVPKVIVVVTPGGDTGTCAAPVWVEHAARLGVEVMCVAVMPMKFEGEASYRASVAAVQCMSTYASHMCIINKDRYRQLMSHKSLSYMHSRVNVAVEKALCMALYAGASEPWYRQVWSVLKRVVEPRET